jgi:rubrerythrin
MILVSNSLKKFNSYLDKDFKPAYEEVSKISISKNRVHIQKILYVSLLNRFDSAIDEFFYENPEAEVLESTIKSSLGQPMSGYEMIAFIRGGENAIAEKFKSIVKVELGRKKHVAKLALMLKQLGFSDSELKKNRVNNASGSILDSYPTQKTHPVSILGYADWLYSRRNLLVHSAKSTFDAQLKKRFKDSYNVSLPDSIRLSIASLKTSSKFYSDLLAQCSTKTG